MWAEGGLYRKNCVVERKRNGAILTCLFISRTSSCALRFLGGFTSRTSSCALRLLGGFVSRTSSCALPKEKKGLAPLRLFGPCRRGLPLHLKTYVMRFAVLVASPQEQVHAPCRKNKPCTASLVRALPVGFFTASPQDIRHALCGTGSFASRTSSCALPKEK